MTNSLTNALAETERRRTKQQAYNEAHGITPVSIRKNISDVMESVYARDSLTVDVDSDSKMLTGKDLKAHIADLETRMREAAADLEFEEAARLRDAIKQLESAELEIMADPMARPKGLAEAMAAYAPGATKTGQAKVKGGGASKYGRGRTKSGRPGARPSVKSRKR